MARLRAVPEPDGTPETGASEPLWRDALGAHLRQTRHERGATLEEIAGRAGISLQYLSEIERGVKDPSSEMIAAVAGALGVPLADLVGAVSRRMAVPARQRAPYVGPHVGLALAA